jgi:uncharacterized protein (TIGR02118 family)
LRRCADIYASRHDENAPTKAWSRYVSAYAVEPGAGHLVAILEFDSVEAIQQALGSPEGQATASDLGNFADGGVDLMVFNTKPV